MVVVGCPALPLFGLIEANTVPPASNLDRCAGKGGKNRRRGKGDGEETKRELEFKEEGQEYKFKL